MSSPFIAVVSGLPRSGTSMMMRMLEAGGMPVLTDRIRKPDEDNPYGYYEFEPVKRLKQDASWLANAQGKAVKIIYAFLYDLEQSHNYKVLLMERDIQEVVDSQRVMLKHLGHDEGGLGRAPAERAVNLLRKEMERVEHWLRDQSNIGYLKLNYRQMLSDPRAEAITVQKFLDWNLDTDAMARVVDWSLYRQRMAP